MADSDGSAEVQNAKRHMDSKCCDQKVSCGNEDFVGSGSKGHLC